MWKLVSILLGILAMLGNVLILSVFVIYILGLVGVQLWVGDLRYQCFLGEDIAALYYRSLSPYYVSSPGERASFICSVEKTDSGNAGTYLLSVKGGTPVCRLLHSRSPQVPWGPMLAVVLTGMRTTMCVVPGDKTRTSAPSILATSAMPGLPLSSLAPS
ncbi:voltage-dependent T-type calcium channel subunit alpha-1G isoform X2 [Fundulus heteroclitus]|uniref:voltage-dependent T-type calcium channel subunit alpha-1G isoform X2 n=1 Tax=Fundulus heteroclitus TaxID=8078 RepID=UPI00165BD2F6|nr:voltage-dependent T-type calcium channel subunit alpha-1G isoform X2 [Fundulus heteroclitus]